MSEFVFSATWIALLIWLITLLLPWQPWRVREVLEAEPADAEFDLSDITVVIPARDEAEVIGGTLQALKQQGRGLKVILVDDDSSDDTVKLAKQVELDELTIIESKQLAAGWTGKLWAQEQGLKKVNTPLTLLLDADIELKPGMLKALQNKYRQDDLQFVSLMAVLRLDSYWEKLLMPAFIYFFKMIYPFALANKQDSSQAAAAGGCILIETAAVRQIGGLVTIKDAVIDDCTLAKAIKNNGKKTWIGLTHGVVSQRPYATLSEIWQMVARTAYTQLKYSTLLLLACTGLMLLLYWWPLTAIMVAGQSSLAVINSISLLLMLCLFIPTLRFYQLNVAWSLMLPMVALLYLLMTWTSALRFWRGERSRWKGRSYNRIDA